MRMMSRGTRWLSLLMPLVLLVVGFMAWADDRPASVVDTRVNELERRFNQLEENHLIEKVAKLETMLDTNTKILMGILAVMITMAVERLASAKSERKHRMENDDD